MSIIIPYSPLPYQRELHNDPHRFRTIVAGRRVGKTTFAMNELLRLALTRELSVPYWYIAPFYHQAKTIGWDMLLRYIPKELWAKKPNETELSLLLINGAKIVLKGCDNPNSLEGTALGGIVIDEISAIPHFQSLWEYTLRPMLSDFSGPAIFISKPRGFNHFHDLAKRGDHHNIIEGDVLDLALDDDFMTYRFQTEQNCREHNGGFLPHAEIEHARKQLSPEAFDQEFLALFTVYSGLVHKLFRRETHCIEPFTIPSEWRRFRGWDFGSKDPTASVRCAVDTDDNIFIDSCYKRNDAVTTDHAKAILQQDEGLSPIPGFGDPSGPGWMKEFRECGIHISAAHRDTGASGQSWLQFCIEQINQKLKPHEEHVVYFPDGRKIERAPSLFIFKNQSCQLLVDELETLSYKEKKDGTDTLLLDDTRDKHGHFDLHAALRYALISYQGSSAYFSPVIVPDTVESLRVQDQEIKQKLKDPEERKKMELEADLAIMRRTENDAGVRR